MLETIAVSILTAVGKKVFDSATTKATGQASDALLSKIKGDPAKKTFKRALGKAVQRYATGNSLYPTIGISCYNMRIVTAAAPDRCIAGEDGECFGVFQVPNSDGSIIRS